MTRPKTARERNLLKISEKAARGFSFSLSQKLDEEEENEQSMPSSFSSDEDMLLPYAVPESVKELPSYLKSACSNVAPASPLDIALSQRSKHAKIGEMKDLLCDFIFASQRHDRMSFRSMTRDVDPLLGVAGNVDEQLFLDYLPILRCISVEERGLEAVFNAAQEKDPDGVGHMTNRQRSTRHSKKKGRAHYLEPLPPPKTWEDLGRTAKEVGDLLANASLL